MPRVRVAKSLAVLAGLSIGSGAIAAEINPAVRVGISRTDNVFLDSTDETDELVFHVEPSITVLRDAERLDLYLDYLLQSYWYTSLEETSVHHRYDLGLELAVVPDKFTIGVGTDRTQSVIDPTGRVPRGNLPISTNRVDRDEYYVRPAFQSELGGSATIAAQYRYSWIDYHSGFIQGSKNQDATFRLNNYRKGTGLTWALDYDWSDVAYDNGFNWRHQAASAELGFWATEKLRFFGRAGLESPWQDPQDDTLSEDTWEAGVAYSGGDRLTAELAVGDRSFGSTWRGRVNVKFRRGSTEIAYSETPNSEGRSRYIRGGFAGDLDPEDGLSTPGGTQRFVSKRLSWRGTVELRRTRFYLSLFDEKRSDRTTAIGTPLVHQSQFGGMATVEYEVGPRSTLRATGYWADREFEMDDSSDIERYFLAFTYELGPKTNLEIGHRFSTQDGSVAGLSRDYSAKTTSVVLSREF